MNDTIEALERLAKLADEGRISETEYETLKQDLLSPDRPESDSEGGHSQPGSQSDQPPTGDLRNGEERRSVSAESSQSQRQQDWRLWVGLVLSLVGLLGLFANFMASFVYATGDLSGTPLFVAFALNVILNPLVWGGIVGLVLLNWWKGSTG